MEPKIANVEQNNLSMNQTGTSHDIAESCDKAVGAKPLRIYPVVVILLVVAVCGLIAFGALPRMAQRKTLIDHTNAQMTEVPTVSVTIAQPGPEIEQFALPGSSQAIQDAPIYARVNGYLAHRYANIGDIVKGGQILADIDTPELDQQVQGAESSVEQAVAMLDSANQTLGKSKADLVSAQANIRKAKSDLDFFSAELTRYNGLAQQGAVSYEDRDSRRQAYNGGKASLDSLEAAERSALASVNSARAAVHVAEAARNAAKASLDQLKATQSFKRVVAPFGGIVTKRNVDAGALITSGSSDTGNTLLFDVAKTDVLRVFVYVPEQYVPYVKVGENAKVSYAEFPGVDFTGLVSNVSGGVDPDSRTLQVEIHVQNADHKLMPGMYASVKFQAPVTVRLPTVPSTVVQTRPSGDFASIVDAKNRVRVHKLEIGRDLGGKIEVSKGLAVGDKVIISPSDEIMDGLLVRPIVAPVPKDKDKT